MSTGSNSWGTCGLIASLALAPAAAADPWPRREDWSVWGPAIQSERVDGLSGSQLKLWIPTWHDGGNGEIEVAFYAAEVGSAVIRPGASNDYDLSIFAGHSSSGAFVELIDRSSAAVTQWQVSVSTDAEQGCGAGEARRTSKEGRELHEPAVWHLTPYNRTFVPQCPDGSIALFDRGDEYDLVCTITTDWEGASKLAAVFDFDSTHRLVGVWLEPLRPSNGPSTRLVPWEAGACSSMFAPDNDLIWPRRGMGVRLEWTDDGDLLAFQSYRDGVRSGASFIFGPRGRPLIIGNWFDDLPHGYWFILDPEGNAVKALLFALGVEIAELPVKNIVN